MSTHIVRERALEAQRVLEAWEIASIRTSKLLDEANESGLTGAIREARNRHQRAEDQLSAARRAADDTRSAWLRVRPLGGECGPPR